MSQPNQCPECGVQLPSAAPRGLCPACLFKRGLETNTAGYTQSTNTAATSRWTPPDLHELAARFPELEITHLIGRGGMGAVYQARQKNLDRIVALKILPPEMSPDPAFADRFAREAQAMARLNHPHIVTIHEFGQRAGWYYFLMEYVDGVNLRTLLDSGHISPKEALAIVPQICDALQYAHDQQIVHRDIKPENILLSKQGQVKIADFGLAKLMGRATTPGATEKIMGTPQYMAPEQLDHPAEVDHRADIYSLGVVFYQMLTGELPTGHFAAPSRIVHIDVRLDEVVLRALEKEPEKRYQHVSDVKTMVQTIVNSNSVAPVSPREFPPSRSSAIKSPIVRIVELIFGTTFTSSLAVKLINFSALGFLAFLSYLADVPLPGWRRFFSPFAGFSGLFGLIGVAILIEVIKRRNARPTGASQGSRVPPAPSDLPPPGHWAGVRLVDMRGGQPRIIWKGVITAFLVVFLIMAGVAEVLHLFLPGTLSDLQILILLFLSTGMVVAGVRLTLRRLRGLDPAPINPRVSPAAIAAIAAFAAFVAIMSILFFAIYYFQSRQTNLLELQNAILQRQVASNQQRIEQPLRALNLAWDSYSIELVPNTSKTIWHFTGLKEFKNINGQNVSTPIQGNLFVDLLPTGAQQVHGDGQLAHVTFTLPPDFAPSTRPE